MSALKMKDVFNTLKFENGRDIDTGDLVDVSGGWWATFNSKQAAMHAANAINSHDKLNSENKRLRDAIHKACSETCNVAVCGTIMMSTDLFNGLVDAYNGCEETKEREG